MSYAQALALTVLVETPAYALGLSRWLRVRPSRGIAAGLALNLVTHPLASLVVMPSLSDVIGSTAAFVTIEVAVWVLEAALLFAWLRRGPATLLVISFVANGLSATAGLLLLQ